MHRNGIQLVRNITQTVPEDPFSKTLSNLEWLWENGLVKVVNNSSYIRTTAMHYETRLSFLCYVIDVCSPYHVESNHM